MKILRLELRAYGPFSGKILDLSGGSHGLHLVYGPNEAGKSAALRALTAFLYGIHQKTPDNFRHDYDALRIGGRLRLSDGTERFFIRRKGSRNTLLDESGSPLDEAELARFIDGIPQEVFTRMYGIDSSSLVEGGRKLAAGEGEIGAILFAAASGIPEVREVIAGLDAEAAGLFKPTGTTPVINRLMGEYRELKRRLKEHSLSAAQWANLEERTREAGGKREDVSRRVREKTTVLNRRKRVREACGDAGELRELQAELDAAAGTVVLPEGFTARRERAEERLNEAGEGIARDDPALRSVREEIASLSVPDDLLAHRASITALFQESGNYKQAGEQLPRLRGNVLEIERGARRIVRELRLAGEEGGFADCCLSVKDRARIEELCERSRDLLADLEHRNSILAACKADLAGLDEQLARLPGPRDIGPLEALLMDCRRSGITEKGVRGLEEQVRSLADASAEMIDRLGLKGLARAGLLSLPVPGKQTVALFAREFMSLEQRIEEAGKRGAEERLRLERIEGDIRALEIQGDIPTEGQLIQVRQCRDGLWRLIRKAWETSGEATGAPLRECGGGGEGTIETFERAMAEADEIGDRLRRESDRVAQLARLTAEREAGERAVAETAHGRQELMEGRQALEQRWEDAWRPSGVRPRTPAEMGEWMALYDEATSLCREWSARSSELEEKSRELSGFMQGLKSLVGLFEPPAAGWPLSALDRTAEELVRNQRDAGVRRRDLQSRIREAGRQVLALEHDAALARERLDAWKEDWARALAPAGLDAGASPDQARAVLRRFSEFSEHVREIEEKSRRIRAIESDNDRFEKSVAALCAEIGRSVPGAGSALIVEQLNRELQEGLKIRERLDALAQRERDLEKALDHHRRIVSGCEAEIRTLLAEAGCDDPRLFPEREALSAAHRKKTARADELRRIISRSAGGSDLEGFLLEVASADADALPQEIAELEREIEELEKRRTGLDQEIGRLGRERDEMAGGSTAVRLSEEAESVLAGIRDAVQDYARLTLAASRMRCILERYRKKNQGRVLSRAGEFFRRITLESLHGLAADFDSSDRQVLVGLRNGGRVPIEAMSEGTRDQLYLALRLAGLEQRLEEREPMPLVLDDVLVNFDDLRALETLKILADLSNRTQVILFTHHRHLCDLAGGSVPSGVLWVQEL